MKVQKMITTVIFSALIFGFPFHSPAQEDEITTTEKVRVVNVEVPVRVFYKGAAVDDLTRKDFKIFEDGKPKAIHGFYIKRKQLAETEASAHQIKQKDTMRSRYFVLVFKIIDYNDPLHRGLEYLFKNIFRESDQCLVFINDKSIFFKDLAHPDHVRAVMQRFLQKESRKARQRQEKYLIEIEDELKMLRIRELVAPEFSIEVLRFFNRYMKIWKEYDNIYLKPDLDNFYYFSRHLEKIKKEKWVINFYQIELFPKLKFNGSMMEQIRAMLGILQMSDDAEITTMGNAITTLMRDIDISMHTTKNFPAEEISKLFIKVDASFHSILIPVNRQILSHDLEYQDVASEIESSLMEITKKTGGSLQRTANLDSAMETIRKWEDITYMLTYSPDNPDKVGKIRVRVENPNYKILYDDLMRADYIKDYLKKKKLKFPDIRILNTDFRNKVLTIEIKDFLMFGQNSYSRKGNIFFEIEIQDANNNILYEKKKNLIAMKDRVAISVEFSWMKKGRYNLIIQVTDIQTGKSSSDFLQPVVR